MELDTLIFQWINNWDAPHWIEQMLIFWRTAVNWIPLYILMIGALIWRFRARGTIVVLFVMLTAGISDFTNSSLLKKAVERPRPCHTLMDSSEITLRVRCGSGFSFPSSHASNHMSIAVLLAFVLPGIYRAVKVSLFFWAILVGIAQVFVGVHYPVDVMSGFLWGGVVALAMYRVYSALPERWRLISD
jgi:membrane-associated phospholipid phosphatase